MGKDWGRVIVGTRLEKQVSAKFFMVWQDICTRGLGTGDGVLAVRGQVAHKAANSLIRKFLKTEAESLLFLDSDADVEYDIIDQFRSYKPGTEYDILQAFYCRRGWPPRAIWFTRDDLGQLMEMFITQADYVEDVAMAGTHCCMVRREVFEAIYQAHGEGIALEDFEWFSYPRHMEESDEVSLSVEAEGLGFRIGATTAIQAGHIGEIITNWQTYQDFLRLTGRMELIERYRMLAELVGEFLGEDPRLVVAKAAAGSPRVAEAWARYDPQTPEEVRAFYGHEDNGYLYDLVGWNCQPLYQRAIAPLYGMEGQRALVIGAGLGTEVEALLAGENLVDVYELPGVLWNFLRWRFGTEIGMLLWPPPAGQYSVVVAVDVLEHVHPHELGFMLERISEALLPGGLLVMHMGGLDEGQPMHYDNWPAVRDWLVGGYEQVGEFLWRRSDD